MPDRVLVDLGVDVEAVVRAFERLYLEMLAVVLFRWAATRGWQA